MSKLSNITTSIFSQMSQLAQEHGAINLSQGFPDFAPAAALQQHVVDALHENLNHYLPTNGYQPLLDQISIKIAAIYDVQLNPSTEITVTSGASEGLMNAILALIEAQDEVIVFEPAYDSYVPAIKLAGGVPVFIRLDPQDYSVDWAQVRSKITNKTKMIIINTPHNPTGATLSCRDMRELESIVCQHGLLCLSDEVYEHIIFDGALHESVLKYPELRKQSLAVFSFGKTYHATGWKIGYTIANKDLSRELRKVHQYNTYCSAAPLQVAMARFMKETQSHFGLPAFYQQKRDFFLEQIADTKFVPLKCNGTYFQMLNFSQISTAQDVDFARSLTKDFGVASIPTSPFYHDKFDPKVLRFCFAKSESTLKQAGARLSKASS
jgi:methionine transaminase